MNLLEKIYREHAPEEIPWNTPHPPQPIIDLIAAQSLRPCSMVELGCGLGNHARFFARLGFDVTGVDISITALKYARRYAEQEGLSCRFAAADLTQTAPFTDERFMFAFDWEVLHHVIPDHRGAYVGNVYRMLRSGGRYISLCFHEDDTHFGGQGKYRETPLGTVLYFSNVEELRALYSPCFHIADLRTLEVPGRPTPHISILADLRKP